MLIAYLWTMGPLVVEFLDEEVEIRPGESLTFGRDARLVIDSSNQYLHRVLGSFVSRGDSWVLHNVGRFIPLVLIDATTRTEIRPGGRMVLLSDRFCVAFSAGPARYELRGIQGELEPIEVPEVSSSDTTEVARYRLNHEQRQMVLALGEPLLRGTAGWPANMPTNREVSQRLGWSTAKLNRKLDYLCKRMAEAGVSGMLGDPDRRANARRIHLVEHLVATQVVRAEDLDDDRATEGFRSDPGPGKVTTESTEPAGRSRSG